MSKKARSEREASLPPKAVIYARVSSKEQSEGYSIGAQLDLLRDYSRNKVIPVVREFVDVETAKQAGRLQFGEMVRFLQAEPTVRIILCEKTDRLYRNFRDYGTIEDLGVQIHLVKESEVFSKDSKSHQKLVHGLKVLMAKNYLDNLSEEVKKGMAKKAETGTWPGTASSPMSSGRTP
jgi:site-specific DNA recombinase